MKNLKKIIFLFLPILLMASQCNQKHKEPNVMKGRLMYGCDTPAPNVKVLMKADNMKTVEMVDGSKEIYTDEDGYFEFRFYPTTSKYMLYAPYKTMAFIPNEKYLDLGEINLGGRMNFIIKLQVNNPYTENDTLYVPDYNSSDPYAKKIMVGPFISGTIIDTIEEKPYTKPLVYSESPKGEISYYFVPYGDSKWVFFNAHFCSDNYSEAIIVIE